MNPRTLISFLVLLPFTLSCNMQKYCNKRFPPEVIRKDSVRFIDRVIVKDTLIYVLVPDEVKWDTVFVDSLGSASSTLETSFAKSKAFILNGKLIHELTQKDSLIASLIKGGIKVRYIESFEVSRETSVIVKNELTGWQTFQINLAWILAIILVLQALAKRFFPAVFSKLLGLFKSKHPP